MNTPPIERIRQHANDYECAIVTFNPERLENLNDEEKKKAYVSFKGALLWLRYGIAHHEYLCKPNGDNATSDCEMLVVNYKDMPNFKDAIFKLLAYYNQEGFWYSPKGTDDAIHILTQSPGGIAEGEETNCESFFEILKEKLLKGEMRERDLPKRLDVDRDLALETFEEASLGAKYCIGQYSKDVREKVGLR